MNQKLTLIFALLMLTSTAFTQDVFTEEQAAPLKEELEGLRASMTETDTKLRAAWPNTTWETQKEIHPQWVQANAEFTAAVEKEGDVKTVLESRIAAYNAYNPKIEGFLSQCESNQEPSE